MPKQGGDKQGNVTEQSEEWAASATSAARVLVTKMEYDDDNRLIKETTNDSQSQAAADDVITVHDYDDAHNRTSKTINDTDQTTFSYNAANQLIGSQKQISISGVTASSSTSYSYDANGNRNYARTSDGQVTQFEWDAFNRLTEVRKFMIGGTGQRKTWSYTYDYRTRRIETSQTLPEAEAKRTAILFSGGLSVAEYPMSGTEKLSDISVGANVQRIPEVSYVRGPDMGGGVGGLLYTQRNPLGTTGLPIAPTVAQPMVAKFNLSNGRGDIVAQSDKTGALTWTASYEAFGKRTKETGVNADKQRANSKDEDPTELLNEGFRYRDIETGVWLSRDPAGFVDGPNLYAYVRQNPWTAFDPDGLKLRVPKSKSNEVDAYIRKNGVSGHQVQQGNQSTKGGESIDTITGSASDDKSLTSEIIARMISSPREFSFKNASDFDAHVNARKANVEYIEKLAKTVGFTHFGGKYPTSSWNEVFTGGRRKDGSQRSRWEPSTDWMTALTELRDKGGQLDCSKPGEFGRMMGDFALNKGGYDKMGNYSSSLSRTTLEAVKDDWIPGDQGKLWNRNPGAPSYWVNENFTSLGGGRFYANGTHIGGSYIHSFDAVFNFTRDMGQPAGQTGVNPTIDQNRNHVKTGLADGL